MHHTKRQSKKNAHKAKENANEQQDQPGEIQETADTAVISDAEDGKSQATESTRRST
jgi:hypothetical protein